MRFCRGQHPVLDRSGRQAQLAPTTRKPSFRSTNVHVQAGTQRQEGRAIVLGSGLSGLATAEVLSKHFGSVLVLEKDQPKPVWQGSAIDMVLERGARQGVTQYNHLHALIAQGLKSYNEIFQGRYIPALQAAGGNVLNVLTRFKYIHPKHGVLMKNPGAAQPVLAAFCSRHLLETTARRLVGENDRVQFMYGAAATDLLFEPERGDRTGAAAAAAAENFGWPTTTSKRSVVTGVVLAHGTPLAADLVVDCSGRHSAVMDWLAAAGVQRPRVSHVTANCGYACWFVRLAPEVERALCDVDVLYCMAEAPEPSIAYLWRVEGGAWVAGVGGYQGHHPPLNDEQLMDFAVNRVWHPAIGQLLQGSQRLAPASRFYGIGNTWRHFDEVQLPEGLVVMADSVCSFSPVYGQGTTVAAVEVATLDKLLAQRSKTKQQQPLAQDHTGSSSSSSSSNSSSRWLLGLSNEFQQAVLPTIQTAWGMASGNDLKFAGAVSSDDGDGQRREGPADWLAATYMAAVFELATYDAVVNEVLIRVMQYLDQPSARTQPAVVGRVLWHALKTAFQTANNSTSSSSNSSSSSSNSSSSSSVVSAARARAAAGGPKFDLGVDLQPVAPVGGCDVAVLREASQPATAKVAA